MSLADLAEEPDDPDDEHADLRAQVELLREENQRLRAEYVRARRTQYRRTALGLGLLGLLALVGAALFPAARTVLIALGAIGLFAALLTAYLTPEQFIAADVGERVYASLASNGDTLCAALGLSDERVYVPTPEGVRLFVPQHEHSDLPDPADLDTPFVVTDEPAERGLALEPTGQGLFDEFERGLTGPLADTLEDLADQLPDALVEQFELVGSVRTEVDEDRLVVGITDSAYGPVDRFDHPVASVLAVGVAAGLDEPVELTIDPGDGRTDWLVTVRPRESAGGDG